MPHPTIDPFVSFYEEERHLALSGQHHQYLKPNYTLTPL
jgi:hypothetical protein